MARTQEGIDRDNRTDNELVDHLLTNCSELSGYTRVPEWEDTLKGRARPDRLLRHDEKEKPLVGVEVTRVLPFQGDNGSPVMIADSIWHQAYICWCRLLPKKWDLTVVFRERKIHTKANPTALAQEIYSLSLQERASMSRFDIVQRRSSELQDRFPLLAGAAGRVDMAFDDQPKWASLEYERLGREWMCGAIENRLSEENARLNDYLREVHYRYPNASVEMQLLLWCPESTIVSDLIELPRGMIESLQPAMQNSGFEDIWYVNGIRNGSSGRLACLQRLYPLPKPDPIEAFLRMTI